VARTCALAYERRRAWDDLLLAGRPEAGRVPRTGQMAVRPFRASASIRMLRKIPGRPPASPWTEDLRRMTAAAIIHPWSMPLPSSSRYGVRASRRSWQP
jgi:hypothetical protein